MGENQPSVVGEVQQLGVDVLLITSRGKPATARGVEVVAPRRDRPGAVQAAPEPGTTVSVRNKFPKVKTQLDAWCSLSEVPMHSLRVIGGAAGACTTVNQICVADAGGCGAIGGEATGGVWHTVQRVPRPG